MDPRDQRDGWIEDQRDAQRATAATVEDQVPGRCAVALGTINRDKAEL
jgi:hypothetical protein